MLPITAANGDLVKVQLIQVFQIAVVQHSAAAVGGR